MTDWHHMDTVPTNGTPFIVELVDSCGHYEFYDPVHYEHGVLKNNRTGNIIKREATAWRPL